ncbi:MAG TPA: heme o synthase [Chthonomonadales bacterium]|nr:heme o synthase [Chthonomonadales bacterium]
MTSSRFTRFTWALLAYTLAVVAWGDYVRATMSGDGCGSHWPLCQNQIIPAPHRVATLIEFSHRVTSGILVALVALLFVWAYRVFPRKHTVRLGATLVLLYTVAEALLGAGLVEFKLVAHNDSIYRAAAVSGHLVTTFLLLACLTLTALWSGGTAPMRIKNQGAVSLGLALTLLGVLALGISGAITALGDTLYPVSSLGEALRQDISPTAHLLIRLRLLHPLIAMSVGLHVLLTAGLVTHLRPSEQAKVAAKRIAILFGAQMLLGLVNVALLAPVAVQLVHLLFADLIWISMICLAAAALAEGVPQQELAPAGNGLQIAGVRAGWKDYLALTKPRVVSLLLFTTLTAMFIAGRPGIWLIAAVAIGGYMSAGAANTINMVIDRDIDGRMERTSARPTVTERISTRNALYFSILLSGGSFLILWLAANLLTAMLALAGMVFYVLIYTMALKRRTWHNIVIGGAAGSFPPLVGWAAVTGHLNLLAWTLFGIIFVWTPVHFWALALLIKEDYRRAGVPMLPVVCGDRVTVTQIALYAVLTAALSALPFLQRQVGWAYLLCAAGLNGALLLRTFQLYRKPERPQAVSLFKYSMVYLALLFLVMALDRSLAAAAWRLPG